jgi:hypothetical protein
VQVKYLLASSLPVLLEYADSIRFCSFFDCERDSFDNAVKVGVEFFWDFENSFVMLL